MPLDMPRSSSGWQAAGAVTGQTVSTNARVMSASPAQVWTVLADGWPQPGARLHHSVGTWPLLLDDITEVVECRPGSLLELKAHAWPAGRADVRIQLRPHGSDTEVVIEENATKGPAALLPNVLEDPLLKWRNLDKRERRCP